MLLANNSSPVFHYWAGRYPEKVGWLVGPRAMKKTRLWDWVTYAMDNDAFTAWTRNEDWDEEEFFRSLDAARLAPNKPEWVAVPDVVGDREATIERWHEYEDRVREYGWPVAFVVQDGMTVSDVPASADVVFVGGSDQQNWKWRNAHVFCENFDRVHIGRVNGLRRLLYSEKIGAESVDGTGWFREGADGMKLNRLNVWLEGMEDMQEELALC